MTQAPLPDADDEVEARGARHWPQPGLEPKPQDPQPAFLTWISRVPPSGQEAGT